MGREFTERLVKSLKPGPKRLDYWDGKVPGFGLRISESGRKTWVVLYRASGRLRRYTLGTYPTLPLKDAREMAGDALQAARKGKDPAGDRKRERTAETFKELASRYLDEYAKKHKKSWKRDRNAINNDLNPAIGHLKANAVRRRDIIELLNKIADRPAPILANRVLEIVRRLYNWGIQQDLVDHTPCTLIAPRPEKTRERVLSDEELRKFWRALDPEKPKWAAVFKLRLMTAQRGAEVRQMRWDDLDLDTCWWTIPPEHSKNGKAHRVPLTEAAADIIKAQPKPTGAVWVFPSPDRKGGPLRSVTKATKRIRKRCAVAFWPHDLRRTAATTMASMGIARLTIGKILNHTDPSVTSVYDRFGYDEAKRLALESWGAKLAEIVEGKSKPANVVALKAMA